MRLLLLGFVGAAILWMAPDQSVAQSRARIFDVALGSRISELPADEWVEPACGTNGGPPSISLEAFQEFVRCPLEETTGLREVWFIYDDEWEYIARAYRDPVEIGRYAENTFYGQPIITSVLIDDDGLVQGYRVVTDPRAPVDVRRGAYLLHPVLKSLFSDAPWQCSDLPVEEREGPVDGIFLKTDCVLVSDDRFIRLEGRLLRKPGQNRFEVPPDGYFESSARLEVFNLSAVREAPCCQASARP